MALTEEQKRDRQFMLGSLYQIKTFLSGELTKLRDSIVVLGNKVLDVKVTNFPKPIDYNNKLETIKAELSATKDILQDLAKKEDPEDLTELKKLGEVVKAIKSIKIPESEKIDFKPLERAVSKVEEAVKNIKQPERVSLDPVVKALKKVEEQVANIPQPEMPQVPGNDDVVREIRKLQKTMMALSTDNMPDVNLDLTPVITAVGQLVSAVNELPDKIPQADVKFPDTINVGNFPPQKTPMPVTNININPLRGIVHSTSTTITTTATGLPGYGVLTGRRAIIFYNNSSTVTVYIGGSGVTAANGIPIEPKSFSPSFDSGPSQIWYGVTASGSADVRTVEIQNDSGA